MFESRADTFQAPWIAPSLLIKSMPVTFQVSNVKRCTYYVSCSACYAAELFYIINVFWCDMNNFSWEQQFPPYFQPLYRLIHPHRRDQEKDSNFSTLSRIFSHKKRKEADQNVPQLVTVGLVSMAGLLSLSFLFFPLFHSIPFLPCMMQRFLSAQRLFCASSRLETVTCQIHCSPTNRVPLHNGLEFWTMKDASVWEALCSSSLRMKDAGVGDTLCSSSVQEWGLGVLTGPFLTKPHSFWSTVSGSFWVSFHHVIGKRSLAKPHNKWSS